MVVRRITATLSCQMTLQKLPFDQQVCSILFESCKYINSWVTDHPRYHRHSAYATMLCPSIVCMSSVTYVLWLNGASYRKYVWKSK